MLSFSKDRPHTARFSLAGAQTHSVHGDGTPTEPLGLHLAGMMLNSGGFFVCGDRTERYDATPFFNRLS
jgi:hypothetical protein